MAAVFIRAIQVTMKEFMKSKLKLNICLCTALTLSKCQPTLSKCQLTLSKCHWSRHTCVTAQKKINNTGRRLIENLPSNNDGISYQNVILNNS